MPEKKIIVACKITAHNSGLMQLPVHLMPPSPSLTAGSVMLAIEQLHNTTNRYAIINKEKQNFF
jgi:hypothetical protein